MDPDDKNRIACPSIDEVFVEFLLEERQRLGSQTFDLYKEVIWFLTDCLNGHGHRHLSPAERELYERLHAAKGEAHWKFTEIFGPEHILENVPDFLDDYLGRDPNLQKTLVRAGGTVTRRLARWLAANRYVETGDAEPAASADRDLPLRRGFSHLLGVFAARSPRVFAETRQGRFVFSRVEKDSAWVEDLSDREFGPFPLPDKVISRCRKNYLIEGIVGRRGENWYFVEIWSGQQLRR